MRVAPVAIVVRDSEFLPPEHSDYQDYFEVPGMKTNLWVALAAVCMVAWGTASTQAQDLRFSDMGVKLVSFAEPARENFGVIRSAFLSDEPLETSEDPAKLAPAPKRPIRSGEVHCSSNVEYGAASEHSSSASGFDISPESACTIGKDSCASCTAGNSCGTGGDCNCDACEMNETCEGPGSVYYAEVQIMWLRAHMMEDAVGKLSEQYNWSPRIIAGYESVHGIGARGRYWHYSHETPILGGDDIRFQFDTMDLEGTARFAMKKTDLLVSAGFRWANLEIEFDDEATSASAPGLTVGADVRMEVCRKCNSQWAAIGGLRWSTLGGDWEGSNDGFVPPVRDDNIVVQEMYGGVEYTYVTKGGYNLYTRLTLEIQNWHSDAMSQLSGTDSLGFVGPGIHAGASF